MKRGVNYPGSSMLTVRGVEPQLPCAGLLPLSWLPNRKPLKVGRRVMEFTCGNILQRSSRGSVCQTASVGLLKPTTNVCLLNTFFSLPGYVMAEAKVCKFLTVHQLIVPVSVVLMSAPPQGILFDGFSGFGTKSYLLFSVLDPRKIRALPVPSSESPHLLGWKVVTSTFSEVTLALREEN
jgi:hypothetical protein